MVIKLAPSESEPNIQECKHGTPSIINQIIMYKVWYVNLCRYKKLEQNIEIINVYF